MRPCLRILFWPAFALALVAAARAQVATTTNNAAVTPPATLTNAAAGYVLDDKHVLEPGDHISFQIIEDRDPARALVVADSRELEVPYVGRVSVVDKTCKQLAAELKVLLEKEYYKRATVIVGLDSVNKVRGKVYILGQVRTQGAVDLLFDEKLTVGQAVLHAGGFGDFANKKKVRITRAASPTVPITQNFEVNLVEVLENGKAEQDIALEPGDLIFVPARAVNFGN